MQVVGNSTIIVNDADVIVVDDHVSPAMGLMLVEELKAITAMPARIPSPQTAP